MQCDRKTFPIGVCIYILPNNLILNIERTAKYFGKILMRRNDIKLDSIRNVNETAIFQQ